MAARPYLYLRAFIFLFLYSLTTAADPAFPKASEFEFEFYSTEVQVTDVLQEVTAYATEYHYKAENRGAVKVFFQGDMRSVYYDNSTYQIMDVVDYNCTVATEYISDFYSNPIYLGWLNKDPLVIGPSAPLWYAQTRYDKVTYAGTEIVRDIKCNKFQLPLQNQRDNLTIEFFFAPASWTTPYKYKNLQIPVRIRILGKSSRYAADKSLFVDVYQINDFAYFKPSLDDFNNLLPPLGLGCRNKKDDGDFPIIPKSYYYAAEVTDLKSLDKPDDVEIQYQRTWYDYNRRLARRDKYTRKTGRTSNLYDFNTGVFYKTIDDGSCEIKTLRGTEFQRFDYGQTSRMRFPEEALNLDGDFYPMGTREFRGMKCDVYEKVIHDDDDDDDDFKDELWFYGTRYYKLVTTVYFVSGLTKVQVDSEMEERIPVYQIITGYTKPKNRTLQLQYNIFGFKETILPEMYSTYRLDRCYTGPESKSYFVLIMGVDAKTAAKMEELDEMIMTKLKSIIAKYAKVPEMRIPYLKADYKPSGVFVTGIMIERPPAFKQFYYFDDDEHMVTNDKFLKVVLADTEEKCANACVDNDDYLCKGFYWCNKACFLKSTDPEDVDTETPSKDLGQCTEYLRAEINSTNFRQAYLVDALENLEMAILNGSVQVKFNVNDNDEEIINVQDIIIGDGPYTGVDASDKPYKLSVAYRKLDVNSQTARDVPYTGSLFDCYKQCKQAGSECSSFSFCPDSTKDSKECVISSTLVIEGVTNDKDLVPDPTCNIYNLKFLDYFTAYPERLSLLGGDKVINSVENTERCAELCRKEKDFKCRGFEYCRSKKACSLHKKHILDLGHGGTVGSDSKKCIHYAARYSADYMNMGRTLLDDSSNVRYEASLEECAKICSEDLGATCKSFNYCPSVDYGQSSCALSTKILRDGAPTTTKDKCNHYEKRDVVHDWDNDKAKSLPKDGFTRKGFAGLVVGMLVLGLVVGALAFVFYSYRKSKNSGEGMSIKFLKNET